MGRLKWHYILNILLLSVLLTTAVACEEGALPEMVSPDSAPSLEGFPVINEFYTNEDSWGGSYDVILYWDVSGASRVLIVPDIGEVSPSGEIRVSSPSGSMMEDTTFILMASNEVGSVTASTVVYGGPITGTVERQPEPSKEVVAIPEWGTTDLSSPTRPSILEPAETDRLLENPTLASTQKLPSTDLEAIRDYPTIHYFIADPESIREDGVSRLRYEVSNADWVEVGPFDGRVISDYRAFHGVGGAELWNSWVDVRPNTTKTYYLTAFNRHEGETLHWARRSVNVTVEQQPTIIPIPKVERILPTINYFNANPTTIAAGGSSKLSWDVSNADTVTITAVSLKEVVSSSGSMSVSPSSTTAYKLTATNSNGSQSQNVTITVEGSKLPTPTTPQPEEKAKPDLIITDIWRTGLTEWHYVVMNQGKVECSGSSSELRIDGKGQVSQNISPLAPGESREFYFSHKFTCESGTSHTWSVVADSKNAIDESDEGNNSRTEKFTCSK